MSDAGPHPRPKGAMFCIFAVEESVYPLFTALILATSSISTSRLPPPLRPYRKLHDEGEGGLSLSSDRFLRRMRSELRLRILELHEQNLDRAAEVIEYHLPVDTLLDPAQPANCGRR